MTTDDGPLSEAASPEIARVPYWIKVDELVPAADATYFVKFDSKDLDPLLRAKLKKDLSVAEPIQILIGAKSETGRGLACLCGDGEWVSVTVRREGGERQKPLFCSAQPGFHAKYSFPMDEYLLSIASVVRLLKPLVFEQTESTPKGLLVVSGSTGTSKSQILLGLLAKHLGNRLNALRTNPDERRLHLVTFEDPIETLAFCDEIGGQKFYNPQKGQTIGVDYTPRQKPSDVASLTQAFLDAKRQTPSVFFVGETRTELDWKEILQFAGTGCLVATTTHANSLVETMKIAFEAKNVVTPSDRGQIANRLIAVLHLRAFRVVVGDWSRKLVLPSLWVNTPQSVQGLVSDGLGSVLPHFPLDSSTRGELGCFGRRYFARHPSGAISCHPALRKNEALRLQVLKKVEEIAISFDLEEV